MAATNFTPIQLYFSTTASAVPTAANLAQGELAINITDGKLYYENNSGVVTLLASATTVTNSFSAGTTGLTPNTATTGAVTLAGTLAVANGGTGLTAGTSGGVLAYTATGTLASSTALAANALVIGGGAGAAPSTTTTGTGVVTALGVNTGTAGAFVVNGGALGSPSSVGTMPAFTLGGTVSGGGNQINNVIIGTTTPLAGSFTTLSATGTLSGGTSGTGYSFSGSAPATSLTLDSAGNVGIGTSSPGSYAADADNLVLASSGNTGMTIKSGATSTGNLYFANAENSTSNNGVVSFNHNDLSLNFDIYGAGRSYRFQSSGTEVMRLDSAGNLGLGVTPSAWGSGLKAIQVGPQSSLNSGDTAFTAATRLSTNAYSEASAVFKRIDSGFATSYYQQGGAHFWETAGSSTAGSTISFSTAMTLDASGNLGIGTTSPAAKLDILNTNATYSLSQKMFNASAGTFFIGQSPAATFLSVDNFAMAFCTNSNGGVAGTSIPTNERMRLDSSGNLLVGTTSNSTYPSRGYFIGNATYGGLSVSAPGDGSGYPVYFVDSNATSATQQLVHFERSTTYVGSINTTNTTTSYATSSDYRLKNSIAPISGALAKVALLKPCTYKWNIDGSEGQGFIAHELQEVCPIAVHGTKDAIDADGKPDYQGVDTSFLVATLTAAMQEQQALITQLTARITALETA